MTAQFEELSEKLSSLIDGYHIEGLFNGSYLFAAGDGLVVKGGCGYANMEWKIKNEADTKHCLGSLTKQFTAHLVLQAAADKLLNIEDKVCDHLPNYRKDTGKKATIYHLLTHTSGIPDFTDREGFMETDIRHTVKDPDAFIDRFCSGDPEFEPGCGFSYSNSGYYILGRILESVGNKPLPSLMKENIFDPLEMRDSGCEDNFTVLDKRASNYEKSESGFVKAAFWDRSMAYAAGAVCSTVEDMLKWHKALYTEKLLPKQYLETMFRPIRSNYACGIVVSRLPFEESRAFLNEPFTFVNRSGERKDYERFMMHSGGIYGVHSYMVRAENSDMFIILLNNTGHTVLPDIASDALMIMKEYAN